MSTNRTTPATAAALGPGSVWIARAPEPRYGACTPEAAPELPGGAASDVAAVTLRQLLRDAGLDAGRFGSPEWNPLSQLIAAGERVVLKPNLVHHSNKSGATMDCQITHGSVVAALLPYVLKARPSRVVIGDAPIQGCDFGRLALESGLSALVQSSRNSETDVQLVDFRCVTLPGFAEGNLQRETGRDPNRDYVLFDLAAGSRLEALKFRPGQLRVTMYDPRAMRRTHDKGRHQYLVAREVIDADVVFNLPKLKTHKKAGVTAALKNMVGAIGHKAYLAHHRKGGSAVGGDCYAGFSIAQHLAEELYDVVNLSKDRRVRRVVQKLANGLLKVQRRLGGDDNIEGSWWGNDTVWRMSLDIQTAVHYGRADGTLADARQRRCYHLTDAIVAGEGEGPLSPTPVGLGLLTLSADMAAAEWVHALLMGFDPAAFPIIREAFAGGTRPLTDSAQDSVAVQLAGASLPLAEVFASCGRAFVPPSGWRKHTGSR